MDKYQGNEKRKHERVYRPLVISYKRSGKGQKKAVITQLRNIGEGGLAFGSEIEFNPKEELEIYIRLPQANEAIRVKGMVADHHMVTSTMFSITRIVFTEISKEDKEQIKIAVEYIQNELGKRHESH